MDQIKLVKMIFHIHNGNVFLMRLSKYYIRFIVEGHELTHTSDFRGRVTYLDKLNMTINLLINCLLLHILLT